jgi:hypothetical protein
MLPFMIEATSLPKHYGGKSVVEDASRSHARRTRSNGRRARVPLSLIAAASIIGVLVAGCGSSSSTGSGLQSIVIQARAQFVGFAACMRSHGLDGYPDPLVSGSDGHLQVTISPGGLNPSSPAFRSADRDCHHLLPYGGEQSEAGANGAQHAQDVLFADCMRSHQVPSFPDPSRDGVFTLPSTISEQAPAFLHATDACQKVQPSSLSIDQSP